MRIDLSLEPADGAVANILLRELNTDLRARYADHRPPPPAPPALALTLPRGAFVVARVGGRLAGCGAVEGLDHAAAEITILYVRPSLRRSGVAARIVDELERTAAYCGVRTLHLHVGIRQPEALSLCTRRGYGFATYLPNDDDAARRARFAKTLPRADAWRALPRSA